MRARTNRKAAEAQLAALYRQALEAARSVGSKTLDRVTAAGARDDAYHGAWLARNALSFEGMRKR